MQVNKKYNISFNFSKPLNIIVGVLSVMISYFYNHSILWAIFHYVFGRIYLVYCLLIGRFADGNFMTIIHHYI